MLEVEIKHHLVVTCEQIQSQHVDKSTKQG